MLCSTITGNLAAVMSVCNAVSAAVAAASAIAESEPHNSHATMIRINNSQRRHYVISAIKYESVKRNNQQVARQVSGFRPLIQMRCYSNAMENARRNENKLLAMLEVSPPQP